LNLSIVLNNIGLYCIGKDIENKLSDIASLEYHRESHHSNEHPVKEYTPNTRENLESTICQSTELSSDNRLYIACIVSDECKSLIDIFLIKKKCNKSLEIGIEPKAMNSLCSIYGLGCFGPFYDGSYCVSDVCYDNRYDRACNYRANDEDYHIDSDDGHTGMYTTSLHDIDKGRDEYSYEC
jgi:hypothetical protein